jgi:hypothetical protein
MVVPPLEWNYREARSSIRLTHADRVSCALSAARWYLDSRSSDTRIVSQRRSPFGTVGRPLPFLACSMGALCTHN